MRAPMTTQPRMATLATDGSGRCSRIRRGADRRLQSFDGGALAASHDAARLTLERDGTCVVTRLLPRGMAERLAKLADDSCFEGEQACVAGISRVDEEFSTVQGYNTGGGRRLDRRLPLSGLVREAMSEALSTLRPLLQAMLGSGAVLWELACLVAEPGAQHQRIHRDAGEPSDAHPVLLTVFIALQDVSSQMGPTVRRRTPRGCQSGAPPRPSLGAPNDRYPSLRSPSLLCPSLLCPSLLHSFRFPAHAMPSRATPPPPPMAHAARPHDSAVRLRG